MPAANPCRRYVGMPEVGDHELLQMADAAGVALNSNERSIVTRLTDVNTS